MLWVILALVVLSPLLVMAVYVEDWSRDLTTNWAWTAQGAADPQLRPLLVKEKREAVLDAVADLVVGSSAWFAFGEDTPPPADSPHSGAVAEKKYLVSRLVRRTGLMRYKDDIWVMTEETPGGTRIHLESRSRLGKGDLGQNPRNLRELRAALAERLEVVE